MTSKTSSTVATKNVKRPASGKALEMAIATSSDGIALLDADSKYYYLNKAHVEQFGYEQESELIGKTWHVFYKPVEIERLEREVFPLLIQNGTWRGETVGVKKNGEPIYQEITLTFLPDGGLICVTRILNKLKEVERQLNAKNASIASIIQQVTSGILLEDANRFVVESNKRLGKLIGLDLDPDMLKGTSCIDGLQIVKGQMKDPEGFLEDVEHLVATRKPIYNQLIQLKDGSYLERDFIPLLREDELQGFLWIYRDVTEHQQAKESLQRLVVREQELNDMRSKLVRTVSHEFKKPIYNTLSSIQLLQDQLKNSGENIYARALNHIVEELEGLNQSVSKLVNYEALLDRSEASLRPVYVRNLVKNYLNYHYKLFILSEKFVLTDNATEQLVAVDMDLFNLAMKNVVDNALKYTNHSDFITVETRVDDQQVNIVFSNPLNSENRPDEKQLGNALYRANPKDDKGLGLGLGIIQHAANLLSGYVTYSVSDTTYALTLSLPLYHEN
ncbi:MAG: PAS domain-containing sensor histidine kinase [Bacteroidetes bacterium]|nr:MAG: PAS domain-containing sensor histidine kinase [Bacteroidota bacterium]